MFQIHLQAQVFDKKGRLRQSKAWVSKSFLKNILGCLAPEIDTDNNYDTVDINANSRGNNSKANVIYCPLAAGGQYVYGHGDSLENTAETLGILVGTGDAANTALTYTLHQLIAHGKSAGQFEYFGGAFGEVTISGADTYFDIERIFRNSSGGSIVVSEYGISVFRENSYGYCYPTLIVRDVFTDPGDQITVADTEIFKATYRMYVTV